MIGTYINYYWHCSRHLWLSARNIKMEQTSEDVYIGKLISESTYLRKKHEVHIEDREHEIAIDFFDRKRKILHEVKKSNKMEELHIWQAKYYMYVMELLGVEVNYAEIDYPKLKRIIKVELTSEDRIKIRQAIDEIENIITLSTSPPVLNKPYCKKCSYFEFCYC